MVDFDNYLLSPDGQPIGVEEWGKYREDEKRVAETTIDGFWVSTVYIGMDMQYGDGPPLIYETMVFRKNGDEVDFSELYCDRYPTREAALLGHEYAVREVKLGRIGGQNAE